MNLSTTFTPKKYLFCFITVFGGGFLWIISNGFNLLDKGFDPSRYLNHAINGCFKDYLICSSPIVNLLKLLGNNSISVYFNFLLLVFCLLCLAISKKSLPYITLSFPILIYYLPQTGKDSFTIIGSLSLISLLIHFSTQEPIINFKKGTFSKDINIILIRIIIIILAFSIRSESLYIFCIITYIFLLQKSIFTNKNSQNKILFLSGYFAILIFAIYQILDGNVELWIVDLIRNRSQSGFASERFSFLLGNGLGKYFARLLFYYLYTLILPFIYLIRALLFNFTDGHIYFGMITLLLQHIVILRNKLSLRFFLFTIPYVTILSTFPVPHLRYLVILYPAILTITKYNIMNKNIINKNNLILNKITP